MRRIKFLQQKEIELKVRHEPAERPCQFALWYSRLGRNGGGNFH